ncbi:glycine oxidase ThiO [Luteimicrobium subarcticum]|uniref:glycine oxidase ThiO n=1 Tax=Luteimicrobium subarcticum TaxID=620910 RepID=UPI001FE52C8B|nr:glycine oxidase ThiO [Luteimicrobium subarcticum]
MSTTPRAVPGASRNTRPTRATAPAKPPAPRPPRAAEPADVLVVGAGIVGAAIAWRAAAAGLTVTLLDPEPGDGATHAAAGMLAPAAESTPGEDAAAALHRAAADAWPAFAAELTAASGVDVGLRTSGTVLLAHDSGDRRTLHDDVARHRAAGLPTVDLDLEEAAGLAPFVGPLVTAAAHVGSDHQVDPRATHRALLAALDATGRATLVRASADRVTTVQGAVVGVVDDAGRAHRAHRTVLAAGVATTALAASLGAATAPLLPLRGVVGQTLRLQADPWLRLPTVLRGLVQGREVYVVPREPAEDGRYEIVVGATTEETPDDRRPRAGGTFALLRDARVLVPALDECVLLDVTQRARPTTPDLLPLVGESGVPGLLVAAGHHRNGVLHAPLTADAVVALLTGGTLPAVLVPADPRRFAPAPRPRRRPAPLAAAGLWASRDGAPAQR